MSGIFDALDNADPRLVLTASVVLLIVLTALERWLKTRELARGTRVLRQALNDPRAWRNVGIPTPAPTDVEQTIRVPIFRAIGWTVLAVCAGWMLGIFQAATWR